VTQPLDAAGGLRERARRGALALLGRMVALQIIAFAGDVYLRRVLSPSDFGAFAIALFALTFFGLFGDAGLGGALIQQAQEPTETELRSIFCLQMGLSLVVAIVMAAGAPYLLRLWPDLSPDAVWLFRALSLNLLFLSARVVPTMLMERHLLFGRLAVLEVLLTVPFYATAALLARRGLGVFALALAVLAQGFFAMVGAYLMRPWRPGWAFDVPVLRPVVRFGLAYQAKNLIGFFTGAITPVYAGRVLGSAQLGLIDWAQRTASQPLRLVQAVGRIGFPLLSRLHDDPRRFAIVLERSVHVCATVSLLFVGVCFGLGPNFVRVVYTPKWLPALPIFYVFLGSMSLAFLAPIVQPALDARGKPRLTAQLSLAWTTAMWILAPFTTARWGATGFALALAVPTVLGNIALVVVLHRLTPQVRLWSRGWSAAAGAVVVALLGHYVLGPWAITPATLAAAVVALAGVFAGIVMLVDRSALDDALSMVRRATPA